MTQKSPIFKIPPHMVHDSERDSRMFQRITRMCVSSSFVSSMQEAKALNQLKTLSNAGVCMYTCLTIRLLMLMEYYKYLFPSTFFFLLVRPFSICCHFEFPVRSNLLWFVCVLKRTGTLSVHLMCISTDTSASQSSTREPTQNYWATMKAFAFHLWVSPSLSGHTTVWMGVALCFMLINLLCYRGPVMRGFVLGQI